jgi:hypothetical protein
MESLTYSKNSKFLHEAILEYSKELSQFRGLHIQNTNNVKNPGTDSIFESLMKFKRDSNLLQKI